MDVRQILECTGIIDGGVAVGDFDVSPAFKRRKHHEEIGGSISFVFVIEAGLAALFYFYSHSRFANHLLWGLVPTKQKTTTIAYTTLYPPTPFPLPHQTPPSLL